MDLFGHLNCGTNEGTLDRQSDQMRYVFWSLYSWLLKENDLWVNVMKTKWLFGKLEMC